MFEANLENLSFLGPNVLISATLYASYTQANVISDKYKLWWTILLNF